MQDNRYSFSVERPEDVAPPKKKGFTGKIAALVLAGALLCSTAGGAAGYFLAGLGAGSAKTPDSDIIGATSGSTEQTDKAPTSETDNPASPVLSATAKSGEAMSIPDVAAKANPAVVAISTQTMVNAFGQRVAQASAGSGFLISDNGYIVTNHHVISGVSKISVILYDGKEYEAKLVGSDEHNDLAVLKIEGSGFASLKLGDSDTLVVGEQVVAIGNPLGELANTVTVGYISAKARGINIDGNAMTMLQTDASISPGNSGGPLLNLYGQVIGIVSAKSTGNGVEGLGFAIPVNTSRDIINDLIEHGYVTGRPYLGITVQEVSSDMARYYGMTAGLYVTSVEAGSAASAAGLQTGDAVRALNGKQVSTFAEFKAQKDQFKAGDSTTIAIVRDGKEMTLNLTFGEEKPAIESAQQQNQFPFPGFSNGYDDDSGA